MDIKVKEEKNRLKMQSRQPQKFHFPRKNFSHFMRIKSQYSQFYVDDRGKKIILFSSTRMCVPFFCHFYSLFHASAKTSSSQQFVEMWNVSYLLWFRNTQPVKVITKVVFIQTERLYEIEVYIWLLQYSFIGSNNIKKNMGWYSH